MPFSFAISGGRRTERTVGTSLILLCRFVRTIPFLYLVRFSRRKRAASASAECMSAIQNCFAVVVPFSSDFLGHAPEDVDVEVEAMMGGGGVGI
eukprot:scaffold3390_cov61-Cyclotella_meneghiniana.AAC.2